MIGTFSVTTGDDYSCVQASNVGHLMVCLCDVGDGQGVLDMALGSVEVCEDHNAIKLRSMVEGGLHCCLHAMDANGVIQPLKINR